MGSFQYKSGGSWADVPDEASPDDQGSILVVYPEPAARDGLGAPCGAVGLPRIELRFTLMIGSGLDWWMDRFANATDLSVTLTGITAYDPRTNAWVKYTGRLLRPKVQTVQPGATAALTRFRDGEIIIEDVTVTT